MVSWIWESGTACASALIHHRHDIFLPHDHKLLIVDLDLGAAVLPKQDPIAHLHVQGPDLPVLQYLSLADRDDVSKGGFLARRVGDDDAARRLALLGFALDDDSIV